MIHCYLSSAVHRCIVALVRSYGQQLEWVDGCHRRQSRGSHKNLVVGVLCGSTPWKFHWDKL